MNICPNCGGDIDALKEMFPDGWTTCEELKRGKTMKETKMQRPIKFRACRGSTGLWVYGVFAPLDTVLQQDTFHMGKFWELVEEGVLTNVGQYTGRKDIDGVEVYDGDLFDVDTGNRIVRVVWFEPQACFDTDVVRIIDKTWPHFQALQNSQWNHRCEVIGNIYENKELLKQGE